MRRTQNNIDTPFIDLNAELLRQYQIDLPDFPFLYPDSNSYQIIHYQPEGTVQVQNHFVGRVDRVLAQNQCRDFFRLALERRIDLAVMPEYSCPIETLKDVLLAGNVPNMGHLWVVGGEAITLEELHAFKDALSTQAHILYNDEIETAQGDFIDPVFLIFKARNNSGVERLVIVIQFKTEPCANHKRFEQDHMKKGSKIYVLNKTKLDRIRFATFICSDVLSNHFGNQNVLSEVYGRSLLVHIQMNPDPRHATFRRYRELIFTRLAQDDTELICVNWSNNVNANPQSAFKWAKLGGSAIYIKSEHMEGDDSRVNRNHLIGLYPTFSNDFRAYCFYFNFLPGIYHYRTSKPCQDNSTPPQARRNGPEMLAHLIWNGNGSRWDESQNAIEDGFRGMCSEVDQTRLNFLYSPTYDALNSERLLNFTSGKCTKMNWDELKKIPSFQIKADEFIGRLTFTQEPDRNTCLSRRQYFSNICDLLDIFSAQSPIPPWFNLFIRNRNLAYQPNKPHRNLHSGQTSATVVYAGESNTAAELNEIYSDLFKLLVITDQDPNTLAIWFRKGTSYHLLNPDSRPKANRDRTELPTDIDGEHGNA